MLPIGALRGGGTLELPVGRDGSDRRDPVASGRALKPDFGKRVDAASG